MNIREQSLNIIKSAYENKELGFQKGATSCLYYDPKTDSCCAVGLLVKEESLFDEDGMQTYPFDFGDVFEREKEEDIEGAMTKLNLDSFKGLTKAELDELQVLHDCLIVRPTDFYRLYTIKYVKKQEAFKKYLYSL